jgi:hypothetical protein
VVFPTASAPPRPSARRWRSFSSSASGFHDMSASSAARTWPSLTASFSFTRISATVQPSPRARESPSSSTRGS